MSGLSMAVKVTGESEFTRALKNIRQSLIEVSSQVQLTTATYARSDSSMAALSAKYDALNNKLTVQKEKVETLKQKYESMNQQYAKSTENHNALLKRYEEEKQKLDYIGKTLGTTSSEYKEQAKVVKDLESQVAKSTNTQDANERSMSNMRTQIARAERDVKNTENAMADLDDEMNKNASATEKSNSAYENLKSTISDQESKLRSLKTEYANVVLEQGKNSDAAKELEGEMNDLDDELAENKEKLNDAEQASDDLTKSLDETGDSAEDASDGFTILKGVIANLISEGIQKLASAIKNQLGSAISRVDTLNSYKKTMENLGYSTEEVTDTTEKLKAGILGLPTTLPGIISAQQQYAALSGNIDEATSLTLALNDATLAGGQGQEKANSAMEQWYQIIAKGKPDMQSWNIINSAMPAQMNQIAESVMGAGAKSQDLFSAWQSGSVTTQQVIDSLIKLDKDGGGSLDSFEKQAKDSTGGIETSMTNVKTAIATGMANIIESVGSENIANGFDGLKKVVQGAFDVITKIVKFVVDNSPAFVSALSAITAGIAAYFVVFQGASIISTATKAITGFTTAFKVLGAAIAANPLGAVIVGITALVAAFITLWNTSEEFRNFWIGLWEGIKSAAQPIIEALSQWFSEAWKKIKEVWQPVSEFFSNLFVSIGETVKPIIDSISSAFKEAWELIKVVWDLVAPYFKMIWENIKTVFSVVKDVLGGFFKAAWEVIKVVWDVVVPFFKTIWDNIKAIFSVVKEVIGGAFKVAWEAIKAVWNVATSFFKAIWDSIAKIFSVVKNVLTGNWRDAWEGIKGIVNTWTDFFKNIWNNIKNVFGAVKDFFKNTFNTAWTAVKNVFSNWGSFFGGLWDTIKNKFSSLGTNIANAIGGAVKSGINGVISTIENTINSAINLINGAIDLINMIPGVGIGKLGKVNLPRLARGGVLDDGARTIIAGESGAEAIVPLENNTKWIKNVASELKNNLVPAQSNNNTLQNINSQKQYDYLVDSFKQALTEVKIELDDEVAAKFVERTVARAIYS